MIINVPMIFEELFFIIQWIWKKLDRNCFSIKCVSVFCHVFTTHFIFCSSEEKLKLFFLLLGFSIFGGAQTFLMHLECWFNTCTVFFTPDCYKNFRTSFYCKMLHVFENSKQKYSYIFTNIHYFWSNIGENGEFFITS